MDHNKPDSTEGRLDDTTYRVEASGWDVSENFFVEKTAFDWSHDGSKKVSLRSSIREGAVVFIRRNQALNANPVFPIAYRAEKVSPRDSRGFCHVSLVQLRPRSARTDELHSMSRSAPGLTEANPNFAPEESWEKA